MTLYVKFQSFLIISLKCSGSNLKLAKASDHLNLCHITNAHVFHKFPIQCRIETQTFLVNLKMGSYKKESMFVAAFIQK